MISMNRRVWSRLVTLSKPFFTGPMRWRAGGALALIIALLLALNGLNVVNSYVGRNFMTAIAERKPHEYRTFALFYVGVFAASTVVAVYYQFIQDRLALLWREWLTRDMVDRYLSDRAYYRVNARGDIDNPDQRISEDVKTFTTTMLSFVLMILNSTITTIAFAGVLWSITPWLLLTAVLYAVFGSLVTILLGYRLVGLNNLQLKKEADLRYGLVHIREYAESIALLHGEPKENRQIRGRLQQVVDNFKTMIAVNRNLGFFTSGYNYLVQIIPILIVAPRYLRGEVPFGVVTQAAMAFAQILGAFSLIVAQFQSISSFAAVIRRLGSLWEQMGAVSLPRRAIQTVEDDSRVGYEKLTLKTPKEGRVLIQELSLDVPRGRRVLITGTNGVAKTALFRATAGAWDEGEGRIIRPHPDQVMFLPQRPCPVLGSLRDQLLYSSPKNGITDERLLALLHKVHFEPILERVGGLNAERDWPNTLSTAEQQLLAFARLLLVNPAFALLDQVVSTVGAHLGKQLYQILSQTSITYITIGDHVHLEEYHDTLLELQDAGKWKVQPVERVKEVGGPRMA